MAHAYAVDIERFGDDHVIDLRPGEITFGGEIADAAITARFFVDRAGNLERAGKADALFDDRLDGNDRCGESAFHVAGAAAVDLAVLHDAGERIDAPAGARLHDVDVRVEMHAGARPAGAGHAADDIGTR